MPKKMFITIITIFLVNLMFLNYCQKEQEKVLPKGEAHVNYYRFRTSQPGLKGQDQHSFSYSFGVSAEEAKKYRKAYKVDYNKSGQVKRAETWINGKVFSFVIYTYTEGLLSKVEIFQANKKAAQYIYDYEYEQEQEKLMTIKNSEGEVLIKRESDIKDGLIREQISYEKGQVASKRTFVYADQELQKETIYNVDKISRVNHYKDDLIVQKEIYENQSMILDIYYYYNSSGNIIKEKQYSNGNLISIVNYLYNSEGDRIASQAHNGENQSDGNWSKYDVKGNLTEIQTYSKGKLRSSNNLSYNDKGDLIKQEDFSDKKRQNLYQYKYNGEGQIIKAEKFSDANQLLEYEKYYYDENKPVKRELYKKNKLIKTELAKDDEWVEEKEAKSKNAGTKQAEQK